MAENISSHVSEQEAQKQPQISETPEEKEQLLRDMDETVAKYLATPLWYPPQDSPCSRFLGDVSRAFHNAEIRRDDEDFNSRLGVLQEAVAYCQFCADSQKEPLQAALNNDELKGLVNVGDIKEIDQESVKTVIDKVLTDPKTGKKDLTALTDMVSSLQRLVDGLKYAGGLPNPPKTLGFTLSMSSQALGQLKDFKKNIERMEQEEAEEDDRKKLEEIRKQIE